MAGEHTHMGGGGDDLHLQDYHGRTCSIPVWFLENLCELPGLCVSVNFRAETVYLLPRLPSLGELVLSRSQFTQGHDGHFPLL